MKLLRISTLLLASLIGAQANDEYLSYSLPKEFEKYGPIQTRDRRETYTKFYKKGSDPSLKKQLLCTEYHKNGQLIKRSLFKDNQLHGLQKEWHSNGKIKSEFPYKEGLMHGICKHWAPNGDLLGSYRMTSGNGTKIIFDSTGRIATLCSYVANQKSGLNIEQNLKLWSLSFTHYDKGKIVGIAYGFRDLHTLRGITYFSSSGQPHGISVDYTPVGQLQEIAFFVEGKRVTQANYKSIQRKNKELPPVYNNSQKYKELLNEQIQHLLETYTSSELVKIPLEFDELGAIVTISGKPFIHP